MSSIPFSRDERRQLLDRYYQLEDDLSFAGSQQFTTPQRQAKVKERRALLQEYGERLPFEPLSRCPYCERVLEYPMDAGGFDGPWWFKDALVKYPLPSGCPHFRVLMGAIDFKQAQSVAGRVMDQVLPGPGAPFVVPRLLAEIPGMKAVISRFEIPPGYLSYPIAYFSEEPVDGALLHQPWGRQAFDVFDEAGKFKGWLSANDKWDFDLQPWIDKQDVLWINPGDQALVLQRNPPCPYVNLPGIRAPQRIMRGKLETRPLPTGETLKPFE